ncbi:enolase C-terminal domain-like protein [Azospirillum halopraeferens]|uniref:enolase C-terminal domain-like protein n=1 Tax=Azospirillum halopraeferens TaxID=34010 RepID=UPI00048E4F30|nr:enolase C-terminal domain-like protein [Azospirillum halopraeferens]
MSPRVEAVTAAAFRIPTDAPESDGTLEWDATTLIVVTARGGGTTGLGYGYAHRAAAALIADTLAPRVTGTDALAVPAAWHAMNAAVRNLGRPGLGAMAVSAVDVALWDLKARLLGVPLFALLGAVRRGVMAYGSGGFTSYDDGRLAGQLAGWVADGLTAVKMKVGRDPARDEARVALARRAIGDGPDLFVDANGAYGVKQALAMAGRFAAQGVSWFEEPVSSDDLDGLCRLVEGVPPGMEVTAGEYGDGPVYFRRMLEAGAVDVLQPDATRCGGVTGFLRAEALADAFDVPLSAHTAPTLHAHLGCACRRVRHVEYFHDHARIEEMLFDGALRPAGGTLTPDASRPGLGLTFREADARRYAV